MNGFRIGGETGFTISKARTKKTITRKSSTKEYKTESLREKMNKAAIENFAEPLETAITRHELYEANWKEFHAKIMDFEDSGVSKLIEQVTSFVTENIDNRDYSGTESKEIPVGCIITGENKRLMSSIIEEICATSTCDISLVRVSSNKCPNVKSAFQNVAKQLIYGDPNVTRFVGETRVEDPDDSQDQDTLDEESSEKQRYLSIYDVNNNWYTDVQHAYALIVLDDVDACPEGVIGELLTLLNCLKCPFTILLGMISEFIPVSNFFPGDLLHSFRIQKFSRPNPKASLENFIELALHDFNSAFRLSGRVIRLFRNYFLNFNFSTRRLLQLYQICLMEHFRKPESIFCQRDITVFWNSDTFKQLSRQQVLESVSHLPAFSALEKVIEKRRTPSKSPKKKGKIYTDEFEETKSELLNKLTKCYNEILEWYHCFLVLLQFGLGLPENPIGKTKTELYIAIFTGALHKEDNVTSVSPFTLVIQLLKNFSATELERRLNAAYDEIQDFHIANESTKLVQLHLDTGIPFAIMSFRNQLRKAVEEDKAATPKELIPAKSQLPVTRKSDRATKATTFLAVTQNLKQNVEKEKSSNMTNFTRVRDNIVQFFDVSVRKKLKEMTEIPFAQVYVFDDVGVVEKQLFPSIPKEVHLALSLPQMYLNCDCCKDTEMASNHLHLPDTSILYKLILEQNYRIVDLNDLYHAFKSLQELNAPKRRTSLAKKKAKEEEDALRARFGQAYDELRFLGVVQRNSRKPDEATKLSWMF